MSKKNVTLLVIVLAVAAVAMFKLYGRTPPQSMDSIAARAKGDPQARVQIIEFIDFQCPACGVGSKMLKEYMDKYPHDVRVQLKYFPLLNHHRHAMQSALYSECAGRQGRFWQFHEPLIEQQPQWSPLLSADPVFTQIAKEAGLDMSVLNACLSSQDAAQTINDDKTLGRSLGVESTPTYFINNKMVVGAQSLTDELNTYFPKS